jgi:DNA-binding Lrp family transcriptional regulator
MELKMDDILKILEKDPRTSPKKIAPMVDMSEAQVKRKITSLEKKGAIRKYKTVIDWEKAGREQVFALVEISFVPERGRGYDKLAERIARFPEVRNIFLVSGGYDLSVLVVSDTMKEVASFISEKLAPMPQVTSTNTHFVLKRYKEDGDILFEKDGKKRLAVSP